MCEKLSDVRFIRLSTTWFDDERVKLIQAEDDGYKNLVIWLKMLAATGKLNQGGFLRANGIAFTPLVLGTIIGEEPADVERAIDLFVDHGMLDRQGGVLHVTNWDKWQAEELSSATAAAAEVEAAGEQLEIAETRADYNAEFDKIWAKYPRKERKQLGFKHYKAARRQGVTVEEIEAGLDRYLGHIERVRLDRQYIRSGGNWFRDHGWEDELESSSSTENPAEQGWQLFLENAGSKEAYLANTTAEVKAAVRACGGRQTLNRLPAVQSKASFMSAWAQLHG